MPAPPLSLLWWCRPLPLAASYVNGALALTRPTAKRAVSIVASARLVLAFAAARPRGGRAGASTRDGAARLPLLGMAPVGDLQVAFALQLDQLAAVMILVVTGVGAV